LIIECLFVVGPKQQELSPEVHFLHESGTLPYFVDHPEDVADIAGDVAANAGIEIIIAHGSFPNPVKIDPDQFAFGIENRTAGIATCGMV
jgi:hypothetical protein